MATSTARTDRCQTGGTEADPARASDHASLFVRVDRLVLWSFPLRRARGDLYGIHGSKVSRLTPTPWRPDLVLIGRLALGRSLDGIYKKHGAVPIDIVGKISEAVLRGLTYLYDEHRIMHRGQSDSALPMSAILCTS
jgi:hypothetical protein